MAQRNDHIVAEDPRGTRSRLDPFLHIPSGAYCCSTARASAARPLSLHAGLIISSGGAILSTKVWTRTYLASGLPWAQASSPPISATHRDDGSVALGPFKTTSNLNFID